MNKARHEENYYWCRVSSVSSWDTILDRFDLTSRSMLNGFADNGCAALFSSMLRLYSNELSLKVQKQTSDDTGTVQ